MTTRRWRGQPTDTQASPDAWPFRDQVLRIPSDPRPLRVAIVNDYELVVAGVAAMLSDYPDRLEIVEQDTRLPVIEEVDIVLFDTFAHVAGNGVGLSDLVSRDGARVVVFTWTDDQQSIESALAQGAAGYLSKELPTSELVKALEQIHAGVRVVGLPVNNGGGDWPGREFGLSAREAEMLALVARGLSNQEIADAVYVSINTVKTYIRIAYRKTGVQRRSQAVAWALDHGFGPERQRSFPRAR